MSSPCEEMQEKIADYVLGVLSQKEIDALDEHISSCAACRQYVQSLEDQKRSLLRLGEKLEADMAIRRDRVIEALNHYSPTARIKVPSIWRTIMKSPITKLAAAAVIIIAVLIGLTIIPDTSGVAWAEVVNNIEKVKAFTYRMKMSMKGMQGMPDGKTMKLEMEAWISKELGMRMNSYMESELVTKAYVLMSERAVVSVIPQAKQYVRMTLTDELFEKMQEDNGDPRKMVDEFMKCGYTELGRNTIDGIEVEGIESKDPNIAGGILGDVVARLWVAVENDLPVRMEIVCYSNGTKVLDMVVDEFRWDVEINAAEFEPNIPDDYKLMADVQMSGDEKNVVEGLSFFAELTGGKYPSEMSVMTLTQELQDAMKARVADRPEDALGEEYMQKMVSLQMLFTFYAGLVTGDKDPAYYGHKVTAEFPEAVLMRW
ncbi:MAG: zf-HC2 domain-containing protein, partial [Planctomycetota bacterium]